MWNLTVVVVLTLAVSVVQGVRECQHTSHHTSPNTETDCVDTNACTAFDCRGYFHHETIFMKFCFGLEVVKCGHTPEFLLYYTLPSKTKTKHVQRQLQSNITYVIRDFKDTNGTYQARSVIYLYSHRFDKSGKVTTWSVTSQNEIWVNKNNPQNYLKYNVVDGLKLDRDCSHPRNGKIPTPYYKCDKPFADTASMTPSPSGTVTTSAPPSSGRLIPMDSHYNKACNPTTFDSRNECGAVLPCNNLHKCDCHNDFQQWSACKHKCILSSTYQVKDELLCAKKQSDSSSSNAGMIAGAIIGSVLFVVLLAGLTFFLYKRRLAQGARYANHEPLLNQEEEEDNDIHNLDDDGGGLTSGGGGGAAGGGGGRMTGGDAGSGFGSDDNLVI